MQVSSCTRWLPEQSLQGTLSKILGPHVNVGTGLPALLLTPACSSGVKPLAARKSNLERSSGTLLGSFALSFGDSAIFDCLPY